MKLHEFQELVKAQRKAQELTNLEKIAKIVSTTKEKEKN
jgi:phage terminase Nu1 subunit (DNA packaging protein)